MLDAGCGTGLLTLALLRVLRQPARIAAVDLSRPSLKTAHRAVREEADIDHQQVGFAQANVLALPFPDDTFELVMTSGVLEYVPLREGMRELARVLAPGGYLLHLPVRPSPASRLLEVMFRFKTTRHAKWPSIPIAISAFWHDTAFPRSTRSGGQK